MRYFLDVTLKLEAEVILSHAKTQNCAIYLKTTDPLKRFRGSFRMPLQQREQVAASQRISLSGKLRKFEQKPELNKDRLRIHEWNMVKLYDTLLKDGLSWYIYIWTWFSTTNLNGFWILPINKSIVQLPKDTDGIWWTIYEYPNPMSCDGLSFWTMKGCNKNHHEGIHAFSMGITGGFEMWFIGSWFFQGLVKKKQRSFWVQSFA